jgi:Uma2 family endonuclease
MKIRFERAARDVTITAKGDSVMTLDVDSLPPAYVLTWDDWLKLPDHDRHRFEILGGELYMSLSPTTRHQRVCRDLMFLIETYMRRTGHGELFPDRTAVRLSPRDVVMPDLLVVLAGREGIVEEERISGAPDLVVEILSPGTARRDLGVKRALYEHSGVAEYWVVDPIGEKAQVYVNVEGGFRFHGDFSRDEHLRSAILPDLEIPLVEIFPRH